MSHRIEKVNKHIQRVFGEILQKEVDLPADVLVTVSHVETAANLQSATIWLYIFPMNIAEATLKTLRGNLFHLQGMLNRSLDFRPLPRISLHIDRGTQHAQTIEQHLNHLEREE